MPSAALRRAAAWLHSSSVPTSAYGRGRPGTGTRPPPAASAVRRPGRRAAPCRPAPARPAHPESHAPLKRPPPAPTPEPEPEPEPEPTPLSETSTSPPVPAPDPRPDLVDRLVVGDRHQPPPHVAPRPQRRDRPARRPETSPTRHRPPRPAPAGRGKPASPPARARPRSLRTVASPHLVNERRARPVRSAGPSCPIHPPPRG